MLGGDGTASGVEPPPALAVGLVDEARGHLAVGHRDAVDLDDERGLGVCDRLAQVPQPVADVGLAGEPVELGGGGLGVQGLGPLERCQIGVALVHRRDLVGRLVARRVPVVLVHRLGGDVLEPRR